jgi:hypothetical protein
VTLLSIDETLNVLHRQARARTDGQALFIRAATARTQRDLRVDVQWSRSAAGGSGYTYVLNGERVDEQAVRDALTAARTA